jgi:hypothetical protein
MLCIDENVLYILYLLFVLVYFAGTAEGTVHYCIIMIRLTIKYTVIKHPLRKNMDIS